MQKYLKKVVIIITALIIVASLVWYFFLRKTEVVEPVEEIVAIVEVSEPVHKVVGNSVEGRLIESYTFGSGESNILLVGGIHGGYEWNSVMLAYKFIDHFTEKPELIPKNLTLTIIPSANPDGLFSVTKKEGRFTLEDTVNENTTTGLGRFNANGVDLNRNFDCKWKPKSSWRGNIVSAGTDAFSEPEALAIKNVVSATNPKAAIFLHSQSDAIYASECHNGILPVTRDIMNVYSSASGYKAIDVFDSYEISGDAEGWLASIGVPAITVELKTHKTVEWNQNLAGISAVFNYFK